MAALGSCSPTLGPSLLRLSAQRPRCVSQRWPHHPSPRPLADGRTDSRPPPEAITAKQLIRLRGLPARAGQLSGGLFHRFPAHGPIPMHQLGKLNGAMIPLARRSRSSRNLTHLMVWVSDGATTGSPENAHRVRGRSLGEHWRPGNGRDQNPTLLPPRTFAGRADPSWSRGHRTPPDEKGAAPRRAGRAGRSASERKATVRHRPPNSAAGARR